MSLRQLTTGAILLVAFCTGLYFWGEWQKRKFDASLPKPPAVEQQQDTDTAGDVTEDTAAGHWHGDEWHTETHQPANAGLDEGVHFAMLRGPRLFEPITDAAIEELLATPEYVERLRVIRSIARHAPKYGAWAEKKCRLEAEEELMDQEDPYPLISDEYGIEAMKKQIAERNQRIANMTHEERLAAAEILKAHMQKREDWDERRKAHWKAYPGPPQDEVRWEEQ